MNTKHISLAFAAVAALLAGCAKSPIETPSSTNGLTDLELTHVGAIESKAAIDGTTFPTEGEIGLFLFKDETATQDYGEGYKNVKYAYNSTKEKWTASPSIKVGSTPGYLYGYYPYSSTATDIKAIPIASSLNGDDVMYATKQTVNDKTASQTAITMNHALARVSITVKNNGYTGDAKLSKIKFSGAEIAPEGTLNALDGTLSATRTDDVTLDVTGEAQTITAAGTTYECLLVPSGVETGRQTVSLTLTIDGEDKTATLSGDNGVIIAQNTKSNITITLSNSGITVQTVSVEDWNVVEIGEHKFTLKLSGDTGIADNLIVQCKPDGNSVKVEVCSKTVKPLVIRIGTDTRVAPVENGNISTFTISDITSDITATLAYAKTFRVTGSIVPDVTPAGGYLDKIGFSGIGNNIPEGRTVTVKVSRTVPGYHTKMVCDGRTVTGDTIVLEDVSKDLEVFANYVFYDYPLPGVFTVANDGRKVKFARGNMWYQNDLDSIEDYSLHNEDEQYQFPSAYWSDGGHISHFMWCKILTESVKKQYAEYSTSLRDNFFTNTGNDHLSPNPDLIVNGQKGMWRVLSGGESGEWFYLLNSRATTYGSGVLSTENRRYAAVKVNDMAGLLIFPDEFSWPTGAGTEPATFNEASNTWNGVNYEGAAFETLQSAGCVFLPVAGFRDGTMGKTVIDGIVSDGFYWSATSTGNEKACGLVFNSSSVNLSRVYIRPLAYSVRLVTDVTE